MISPDFLAQLRCPLDPNRACLTAEDAALICQRCGLKYPIRDGLPVMIVEEAQLPVGCSSLEDLPCQREKQGQPVR
jgi:uncharacterized protein YbaR (Trm112 family)